MPFFVAKVSADKRNFYLFQLFTQLKAQISSFILLSLLTQKSNFDENFILINLNSLIHYEWEKKFFLFIHFLPLSLSHAAAMIIMPFLFYLFSRNLIFFSFESIKKKFFLLLFFIRINFPSKNFLLHYFDRRIKFFFIE